MTTSYTVTISDNAHGRSLAGKPIPRARSLKTLAGAQSAALRMLYDSECWAPKEMSQIDESVWMASSGAVDVWVQRDKT